MKNFFVVHTVIIIYFCITQSELLTQQFNETKIGNKSKTRLHPAIIEGYPAKENQFPYVVRLFAKYRGNKGFWVDTCTGQTLNSRFILTAAHCVYEKHESLVIIAGNPNLTGMAVPENKDKYFKYKEEKSYPHPSFSSSRIAFHDIALVKTKETIDHPGHAFIEISYQKITGPIQILIYGFGLIKSGADNHVLYAKDVKAEPCVFNKMVKYPYLCLMERAIAVGDSGGGMIYNNKVIAIASFTLGPKLEPGADTFGQKGVDIYTVIKNDKDFIDGIIGGNGSNNNSFKYLVILICFILFNK